MITSRVDVLETEDARTEYGLPKIWVKLAHAYTADTRLSASSPPCALLESLGTRLIKLSTLLAIEPESKTLARHGASSNCIRGQHQTKQYCCHLSFI